MNQLRKSWAYLMRQFASVSKLNEPELVDVVDLGFSEKQSEREQLCVNHFSRSFIGRTAGFPTLYNRINKQDELGVVYLKL